MVIKRCGSNALLCLVVNPKDDSRHSAAPVSAKVPSAQGTLLLLALAIKHHGTPVRPAAGRQARFGPWRKHLTSPFGDGHPAKSPLTDVIHCVFSPCRHFLLLVPVVFTRPWLLNRSCSASSKTRVDARRKRAVCTLQRVRCSQIFARVRNRRITGSQGNLSQTRGKGELVLGGLIAPHQTFPVSVIGRRQCR